jgi:gamma-glutamyltranspeptidase/glutathione hydrolase
MHTIIPGMLRQNGRVTMPFGVMGGAYQPCGHARFVSNLADYGMDPQAAIDAPALLCRARGAGGRTRLQPPGARTWRGWDIQVSIPATPLGGAQAILIGEDGGLTGASDPRKDGCALGY